jgi:DNA-binding GntR family transcriptional regulator
VTDSLDVNDFAPAITRVTMSAQAAQILRDAILTGKLKPGETLAQDRLSKLLGMSPMPIREALLRLGHEGFVESHPNRSFVVAHTTREDVRDAYWLYSVVASKLIERGTANDAKTLADQLTAANTKMDSLPSGSSSAAFEAASIEFHDAINQAAGSPKLVTLLGTIRKYIPEHIYSELPEWVALSLKGHKTIAAAVRSGDPDRAAKAMAKHVLRAGDYLIQRFTDAGYWATPDADELRSN